MVEGRGERITGTPNTIYDLSSVLFHALKGGASYDRFVRDAEGAGDQELAGFFRRVRDEDGHRANEARRLLAERTLTTTRTERAASGAPPEPSYTTPVTEETPSRAVERETATTRTPEEGTKREEDQGLVDSARDYLLGEDRERDYLRGEDR